MLNFRFEVEARVPQNLSKLIQLFAEEGRVHFSRLEKKSLYLVHFPQAQGLRQLPAAFFENVRAAFCDANHELLVDREYEDDQLADYYVEILFRPGVTDNVGTSASQALALVDAVYEKEKVQVFTAQVYSFWTSTDLGQGQREEVMRLCGSYLANPLLQKITLYSKAQWQERQRFEQVEVPLVALDTQSMVEEYPLDLPLSRWMELNQNNCWALSEDEIVHVRDYFSHKEVQEKRQKVGLSSALTDVEMEVIAQSWSEHCKHKIFAAQIEYREEGEIPEAYPRLGELNISSLYKTFIKGATKKVVENGVDWTVSVFSDNAGIVRFDAQTDVCIKVETHNSPSALDPYGGALTGILGVNRDILGVGLGARPIANTDIFCFGPPDFKGQLPQGVKHPKRILEGVHLGVEDGGNKSGIPTVNGSFYFDDNYCGKPLVYCGTIGVIPARDKDGRELAKKTPSAGDKIVMCGGRIGKDGIHGATMSSMELSASSPVTAVQIGDPITQKRLMDFTLEARDMGLFTAITDNGAGGLSSSIGEMSTLTGGADLDLTHAPVKYPGLRAFELLVSESQERMSYAVAPAKLAAFLELAQRRNVEAAVLGTFTDSGFFHVRHLDKTVLYLDLHFLHESLPQMKLQATWTGPLAEKKWTGATTETPQNLKQTLLALLARPNIASKEKWVRRYDHEVQAATIGKPFCGKKGHGPSDAAVLWMYPHGGEKKRGLAISHGLAPRWSQHDPYWMAVAAVDEAVRNAVCVGGNPDKMALVDNFCWPDPLPGKNNPDHAYKLAQLVRTCRGLYDVCVAYAMPLVSGKDSMKNDLIGRLPSGTEVKISVPPTLLVSGMCDVPDVSCSIDMSFKKAGDLIYLLGDRDSSLAGSELQELWGKASTEVLPKIDINENIKLYRALYQATRADLIESAHDLSDGGLAVALSESALAGEMGALIEIKGSGAQEILFNEKPGQILVSVSASSQKKFEELMTGLPWTCLGRTQEKKEVEVQGHFTVSLADIHQSWGSLC